MTRHYLWIAASTLTIAGCGDGGAFSSAEITAICEVFCDKPTVNGCGAGKGPNCVPNCEQGCIRTSDCRHKDFCTQDLAALNQCWVETECHLTAVPDCDRESAIYSGCETAFASLDDCERVEACGFDPSECLERFRSGDSGCTNLWSGYLGCVSRSTEDDPCEICGANFLPIYDRCVADID